MNRVLLIALGVVCLFVALPLMVGGAVAVVLTGDAGPTLEGRIGELSSPGRAVVSETLGAGWDQPLASQSEVRVGVRDLQTGGPVFIGYGPADEVAAYLAGTSYTVVRSLGDSDAGRRDITLPDAPAPPPPAEQAFWVAEAAGPGLQEIVLFPRSGDFRLVAMNADASLGPELSVHGALDLPFLRPVGIGLLVGGGLLAAAGAALLIGGIRTSPAPPVPAGARQDVRTVSSQSPPLAGPPADPTPPAPTDGGSGNPWLRDGWQARPAGRFEHEPAADARPDQQPTARQEQTAEQQLPEESPQEGTPPEEEWRSE